MAPRSAIFTMHNVAGMTTSLPARAATAFIDSAPESERSAFVACYVRSLDPRTEAEFAPATAMAEARWRSTRLWKLEASVVNRAIGCQKTLNPAAHATMLIAFVLSSCVDVRQTLDVIDFLASRYQRQYIRARTRLRQLRREAVQQPNFSKQSEPNAGKTRMPPSITAQPNRRRIAASFL